MSGGGGGGGGRPPARSPGWPPPAPACRPPPTGGKLSAPQSAVRHTTYNSKPALPPKPVVMLGRRGSEGGAGAARAGGARPQGESLFERFVKVAAAGGRGETSRTVTAPHTVHTNTHFFPAHRNGETHSRTKECLHECCLKSGLGCQPSQSLSNLAASCRKTVTWTLCLCQQMQQSSFAMLTR